MLKGISPILSPDLLKMLASMGHGDEIVIADGNFPADAMANRLVRLDGHGVVPILKAVLDLIPLDKFVDKPAALMQVVPGTGSEPEIWADFRKCIADKDDLFAIEGRDISVSIEMLERFAFYERAKNAYAIVATGETAVYANIILKKGVVILPD